MKNIVFAVLATAALVGVPAAPAIAAVNCGMVKKDLDRGRTPQDIAEKMAVSVSEVNKCKNETGATTAGSAQRPVPGEGTGATPTSNPSPGSRNSK